VLTATHTFIKKNMTNTRRLLILSLALVHAIHGWTPSGETHRRFRSQLDSAKITIKPIEKKAKKDMIQDGRNLYLKGGADEDARICYDAILGKESGNVLVLPYLYTPKNQGMAASVESWCRRKGQTYVCADYHGVSKTGGPLDESGTISRWTQDTISVLEATNGKTILVGAAAGAWVMLRVAVERPDLVAGLVGVSCDPDLTEMLWAGLPEEDKVAIMDKGRHEITWGDTTYEITRNLIVDGKESLVLAGGPGSLAVNCPVRLIHGTADEEVPLEVALRISDAVTTDDVEVRIVKGMKHFIEREAEFKVLDSALNSALKAADLYEFDLTSPGSG